MFANRGKRDILLVTDAGRKVRVKQVEEGSQRSIAEMKEIIQREREARQQAQLAAEQALTAAKEAQKVILELEQELERKDQQLEQERAAREQVQLAAQRAAIAAEEAVDEHKSSPVKVERDECVQAQPKGETEESNTDDDVQSPLHAATTTDKSSPAKRPRECTEIQSPPASKKPRGPNKDRIRASQGEASKQKMSLEEARKAAQEEIEKRVEERAKQLSSKK